MRDVYLRYFARTDETDLGRTAAAYCDLLVKTGRSVRLVPARVAELQLDARGRSRSAWDRHRGLLITAMDGAFINVVCGEPVDWDEFYTHGVKNVLLLTEHNLDPSVSQPTLMDAVAKYDHVIAPSAELATVAERVTGLRPVVVQFGGEVDHLRTILTC